MNKSSDPQRGCDTQVENCCFKCTQQLLGLLLLLETTAGVPGGQGVGGGEQELTARHHAAHQIPANLLKFQIPEVAVPGNAII